MTQPDPDWTSEYVDVQVELHRSVVDALAEMGIREDRTMTEELVAAVADRYAALGLSIEHPRPPSRVERMLADWESPDGWRSAPEGPLRDAWQVCTQRLRAAWDADQA